MFASFDVIKTPLHHMRVSARIHAKERFDTLVFEEFGEDSTLADVRGTKRPHTFWPSAPCTP